MLSADRAERNTAAAGGAGAGGNTGMEKKREPLIKSLVRFIGQKQQLRSADFLHLSQEVCIAENLPELSEQLFMSITKKYYNTSRARLNMQKQKRQQRHRNKCRSKFLRHPDRRTPGSLAPKYNLCLHTRGPTISSEKNIQTVWGNLVISLS